MKELSQMNVLVIGLGQIGGSICCDLTTKRIVGDVSGFDRDFSTVSEARRRKMIDHASINLLNDLKEADIVILAVPVRKTVDLALLACKTIKNDAIILDVAGVKNGIIKAVSELNRRVNYVGGHPIAGTEGYGLDAAEENKFSGATFVLTPSISTRKGALGTIEKLIKMIGARPLVMDARDHDRLISLTSGLPYAMSVALMNLAIKNRRENGTVWKLAGGSFRSATRVAASSTELTLDMFLANSGEIARQLERLMAELGIIKKMISSRDEIGLENMITKAKQVRERL